MSAPATLITLSPWQATFAEKLNDLALAVVSLSGRRRGVVAVVLSEDVALSFGLALGEEARVATAGGYVAARSGR